LVRDLGIDGSRSLFTGDEGFYLPPGDAQEAERHLQMLNIPVGYIAAQFRLDLNSPFREQMTDFARLYSDVAKRLGKPLVFIPFSYADNGDDCETHRLIAENIDAPHFLLDLAGNAQATKAVLSKASLAIGVANHFCAFAASVGVPTVGIHGTPYMAQKLDGLMRGRPYVMSIRVERLSDIDRLSKAIVEHALRYADAPRHDYYRQKPEGYGKWLTSIESKIANSTT
jgi:hypothetical protein